MESESGIKLIYTRILSSHIANGMAEFPKNEAREGLLDPILVKAQPIRELELVALHVASIEPKKASKLMSTLAMDSPLQNLQHIKRIRRVDEHHLEIVLCEAEPLANSAILDRLPMPAKYAPLPSKVVALAKEHGILDTRISMASKYPAGTRAQWEEWTQHWPISWLAPSARAADPEVKLQASEMEAMKHWMQLALHEAAVARQQGAVANAALLVNPASGHIVSKGRDMTTANPLQHAAMVAIDAAAAENRRMFTCPASSNSTGIAPVEKVQRTGRTLDVSAARLHQTRSSDSQREAKLDGESKRPYLCTGYDCFVVEEPCAMCAMALVHSRVSRVFYCKPDLLYGALGGSYKLHSQRSLNHHYTVYRVPLTSSESKQQ